ncbi:MAG: DNA polymerase III subunit gamma/tau [Elusimicrobiota bacterium]
MSEGFRALTLKYRPAFFKDVAGQQACAKTLANAVALGRIHPAYLFHGSRGCGKTSMARIFAKALNCKKRDASGEPCGDCISCRDIAQGRSLDVLEIDAASHTGVEHVREAIIDTINLAPARDKTRVFIVDEVHMLSGSAFNAMLKTLEDPPPHVVFILATTELHKVPATVVSRTQSFPFRSPSLETIKASLQQVAASEEIVIDEDALTLAARAARGSFRDAIGILEQAASLTQAGGAITYDALGGILGFVSEAAVSGLIGHLAVTPDFARAQGDLQKILYESGYAPGQVLVSLYEAGSRCLLKTLRDGKDMVMAARLKAFNSHLAKLLGEIRFAPDAALACETGLLGFLIEDIGIKTAAAMHKPTPDTASVPKVAVATSARAVVAHAAPAPGPVAEFAVVSVVSPIVTPLTQPAKPQEQTFAGDWQLQYRSFLQAVSKESFGYCFENSMLKPPAAASQDCVIEFASALYCKGAEKNKDKIAAIWRGFFGIGGLRFEMSVQKSAPVARNPVVLPPIHSAPSPELQKLADMFGGKIKKIGG